MELFQNGPHWPPSYDLTSEGTCSGKVAQFMDDNPHLGAILLQTEQALIKVLLGPLWFMTHQNFSFCLHKEARVTGSFVESVGKPLMICKKLIDPHQVVYFRDPFGKPLWAYTPSPLD